MPYPAIKTFCGSHARPYIEDLNRLQHTRFKDLSYIVSEVGDLQARLESMLESNRCLFVLAFDGIKLVGAATGLCLDMMSGDIQSLFRNAGYQARQVFYMRGAMLLDPFRGQGVGAQFFEERESHARRLGCRFACIWVAEENSHAQETHYKKWWKRRGYRSHPQLRTTVPVPHSVNESGQQQGGFWLKRLS